MIQDMNERDETTQPSPAEDAGQIPEAGEGGATPPPSTPPPPGSEPPSGTPPPASPPTPGPSGGYAPYGDYRQAPRLTRRTDDRVIGGVAGGVADYFRIDPLIVRLIFVILALVGGGGILLYVLGWIFIPARGEGERPGVAPPGSWPNSLPTWLGAGLIVIAVLILLNGFGRGFLFGDPGVFFALVLIGLGAFLLRREPVPGGTPPPPPPDPGAGDTQQSPSPPPAYTSASPYSTPAAPGSVHAAPTGPAPPTYPAPPPGYAPAQPRPRRRSRLGVVSLAVALLVVGTAAVLNNLGLTSFEPGQLGALALIAVGLGLVVGAWWGRARWLIALGVLLVPLVAVLSLVDVPLRGSLGQTYRLPRESADLARGYQVLAGEMTVDFSRFEFTPGVMERLEIEVTAGQTIVRVPRDVYVEIDSRIGAGEIVVFGDRSARSDLWVQGSFGDPASDARLAIEIDQGVGEISVDRLRRPALTTSAGDSRRTNESPRTGDRQRRARQGRP